jgi:putative phosphoribosyl transferase
MKRAGIRHDSPREEDIMFHDRKDAGERLAEMLLHLRDQKPVVLALPRGGVAVGFDIARRLGAPLDIVLVRKIGVPWQPELALGALADCAGAPPEIFIDERMIEALAIPADYVREETARQLVELERRRLVYCAGRPPVEIAGCTAIVVDDGIATGATMRVALRAVRRRGSARLVLAAPVAAAQSLAALAGDADETVCVETPEGLGAIGYYYGDFHQMRDAEVTDLLARSARSTEAGASS